MGGKGSGRKKTAKSGAPGTEGNAEAWEKAAKASEKAQSKLPLDAEEEQVRTEIELPTPLSADAVAFAARKAAEAQQRIEDRNRQIATLKTQIATLKESIGDIEAENKGDENERAKHLREVGTGNAWGLVPCIERHLFRTRTVSVYRVGTGGELGEHVRDRAMTPAELEKSTFEVRDDAERIDVPAGVEVVH